MYFTSDKCFGVNQAFLCVTVGRHLELMKTFPPSLCCYPGSGSAAEELSARSRRG